MIDRTATVLYKLPTGKDWCAVPAGLSGKVPPDRETSRGDVSGT